jgi:glycosyltransferase involved in cell wall biosynthesis
MQHLSPAPDVLAVSVVIPCRDEAGNLPTLIEEVGAALSGGDFEVIVVDDGSTDGSADILAALAASRPWLRHLRHARSCGQSAAVRSGLLAAKGDLIATMDGDGQNDPIYVPKMLERLVAGGPKVGIVAGQRQKRTDSGVKRLASLFANRLRGAILKDGTADSGCGLKAGHRRIFLRLPYFDGWHRYLPALVIREGYEVAHFDVVDRKRGHGTSKYGIIDRGLVGILDLAGVWWLRRRMKRIPEVTEIECYDR